MTRVRLDPASLPDGGGHFGRFGGRFVPETLMGPLVEQHAESPELPARVGDFITALKAPLRGS